MNDAKLLMHTVDNLASTLKVIVGVLELTFYSQTGVRELSTIPHHIAIFWL